MPRFLRTNLDPEGKALRVDGGFKAADGTCYLLLHRLPPHYAKPPTFVVKLTGERMEIRGRDVRVLYRAYAIQDFTPKELDYLAGLKEGGTHAPFFNFSYPNVLKRMGKLVYRLTDEELAGLVETRGWKLVGGTN